MGESYRIDLMLYDGPDDQPVKTWGPFATEREAERVDRGVNINLNHAEYYTVVRPTPVPDHGE